MDNPVDIPPPGERQPGLVLHRVRHGDLGLLALGACLVAELDEGHEHGQHQPADQDVEYPRHVAEGQLTLGGTLLLLLAFGPGQSGQFV